MPGLDRGLQQIAAIAGNGGGFQTPLDQGYDRGTVVGAGEVIDDQDQGRDVQDPRIQSV